jgi:hypothetical protein
LILNNLQHNTLLLGRLGTVDQGRQEIGGQCKLHDGCVMKSQNRFGGKIENIFRCGSGGANET